MSHRNRADLEGVETSPDGRYIRFDEKLGAGAYKSVWLAYDTDLGIEVAWNTVELKRLPEREKIRLKSETDILKNLNHNCIINFYNSWENPEAEQVVFTTEIVTSGTLKQYVSRFKPIKLKVIKKWCRQILQGLCYLHSKNPPIIHRDLKCDNIFINGSTGDIRIGDLGLSTMRNATHVASVLGTPEFMAPELYDEWYTEKVDVYAFGMVVLEMISNEYPYAECTNTAQIYKKVSAGIRPESLNRLPNSATRDFIELCLAKSNLRLAAEDLTRHPFLDPRFMDFRERFSIPYEPINGASPSTPLVPVMELAAVAEHSQLSTDQPIFEEERQDSAADASEVSSLEVVLESTVENIARIALRLDLGSRRKEIKFPFDLESDTADAVAVEMVKELGLQQSSQPKLADGIYLAIKEEKAKWRQAKLMPSNVTRTASVVADTLQHLHIAPQQYGASLQPAPLGTIDAIADIFTGVAAHPLEKLLEPSPPTASNLPQPSFHAQTQNPSQANFPLQNQTNVPFVNASSTLPLTGAQIPSPFQAQQSLPFSSPTPVSSSFSVHSSSSENGVLPTTGQFQKTVPAAVAHPSLPATQAAFSTPAGSTSGLASTNSIPVQPPPFSSLSTKVAPTFLSDAGSQSSIPVPGQVSSAHSSGMSQASTQSSPPSAAQSHNASSLANQSQPVPGHPNLQGYPQSTTFLQPAPTLVQVQSAPIQFPSASNTPPFPSQPPSSFQIHSQSSPTTATPYPSGQVPAVAATGAPSTPAIFAQTPNFSAPSGSVPSAIQSSQQSNGNAPPVQTFQAEPPNASAEASWSASNIPSAISGSGPAQPLHVSGLSSPPAVAPRVVKRRSIDDGRVSESGIQEGEGSNDSVSSRSGKSSPDAALDMSAFLSGFDTSILNTTQVSTLRSIRSQLDDSIRALKAQYAAMYREAVNKYKSEVVDSLTGWGISVPPLNLKAQGVPSNRNQGGHRTLRSVGQLSRRTRDVINIAQGSFSDLQSLDAPASAPNSTNNPSSVRVPSSQGPDIADHIYNRLIQPFAPADSSSECSQDLQTINSSQASVANMQQASQLQPSSQSQPIGGGYWPTDMDIIDPLVWDHTTQPSS